MIDLKSILEEIARNLGEEKLNTILEVEDPNRPYQDTPLSPAEQARAKISASRAQTPSRVSSSPTKNQTPAQQGARTLRSAGNINIPVNKAVQRASAEDRDSTDIQRNSVVGRALPVAAQKPPSMQASRPSIRSGLNRAGLNTQAGVVGGATPADRARQPTAAPSNSSFAPTNVARQAAQNRANADDRDTREIAAATSGRSTPTDAAQQTAAKPAASTIPSNTARMAPNAMTGGGFKPEAPKAPKAPTVQSALGPTSDARTSTFAASSPQSAASTPTPPRRAVASRPAASSTPSAPEPKSKQMFQSYSDAAMGGDDSPEKFFAADRQLQKEKPLRESLEFKIRKILKG